MGLYTFLYGNPLYRLYIIHIQPPLLVTARLSRYTAHTAYTAIQPYTPYIIQRYTASLSSWQTDSRGDALTTTLGYVQRRAALRDITNHI